MNSVTGAFDVIVSNVTVTGGVKQVQVPVWSKSDQSDIVWYNAEKQADGSYRAHIDVANHDCNFSKYQVHTYVKSGFDRMYKVGQDEVDLTGPGAVISASLDETCSAIKLDAWLIPGTFGQSLKGVSFAVWTEENGQDDLRWYAGTASSDRLHTYAYYANGSSKCVDVRSINVKEVSVEGIQISNVNTVTGSFDVIISNVTAIGGVEQVQVPVWSKADQSDVVWYVAEKQTDGTYRVHVDVANHGCSFTSYQVHTYVKNNYGQMYRVGQNSVDLTTPGVVISAIMNENCSELTLDAWHVPGTFGQSLKGVSFALWSEENGQDDLQWYTGVASGDRFIVNVPIENHTDVGCYSLHLYADRPIGNEFVGGITFDRPLTEIMGKSQVEKNQLVNYYLEHATYPTYYENTDAATLDAFCQIYIEECNAEGVKAEVAFCQAMLETGFLSYGGDVDISQHNFAGIGATGNGNPGNSFSTVREGVRAQVQHLKAYASSDNLVQECVDPRFAYVTRESAPYVEWLGIQENPYGSGWAAADNYGYTLRDNYLLELYR